MKQIKNIQPLDLINFSKLNKYYNLERGSIRKDKIPKRYKKRVDDLITLIEAWQKEDKLYTKDQVENSIKEVIKNL